MISILDHSNKNIALSIIEVFQESYAVEAEILKAVDFPPLKRPIEDFINSTNSFFGFTVDQKLAGIVEIKEEKEFVHIQSLVVKPDYFRQGIAQQLIDFVFSHYVTPKYMVETGIDNTPAVNLYLKNKFIEFKQWDTDHGVRKVRFERIGDW